MNVTIFSKKIVKNQLALKEYVLYAKVALSKIIKIRQLWDLNRKIFSNHNFVFSFFFLICIVNLIS